MLSEMDFASKIWILVLLLILGRWITELALEWLNRRHVLARAKVMPATLKAIVDEATYVRSVEYTLAKGRFRGFELTYSTILLLLVLFSGVLPTGFDAYSRMFGGSIWAMAGFLFLIGVALSMTALPLDWYAQFQLEQRFGFNTSTQKTWWTDRLKGLVLSLILGYPLLALLLFLVNWAGKRWWLWAWGALMVFQLLMTLLAPILILPLFNKFTPLPETSLRERLFRLANRTRFRAASIQVMDGSRRSRHSNAFFTGLGGFRKIVLFDTLIQQLTEPELEAVLAHEIGHYKKRHIPKMLVFSAAGSLLGFYCLALLAQQPWFYRTFGFQPGNTAPAFLLFALLAGVITFWFSPLAYIWSRRYEYQADRFAAEAMGQALPLIGALRKLNEKNLSNLTPHPLYSGFYYSHPTLLEREAALAAVVAGKG
ncbi:MAG TPA: M48 family metallopeptidase [Candidatus Limnocylindrales bacterium]|nr:M48 family metallopeptidase [Candidatus Limnocylindrales bacterium]